MKKHGILIVLFCIFGTILWANDAQKLTWEIMEGLNYETGQTTPLLQGHHNQTVEVEGFIVPLEMDGYIERVSEFLLVPDPLACIHVPPPPPNQMIFVKMTQSIPLDMDYRGIAITGKLMIAKSKNGVYGYKLAGVSAKEANIEYDDPLLEYMEISY